MRLSTPAALLVAAVLAACAPPPPSSAPAAAPAAAAEVLRPASPADVGMDGALPAALESLLHAAFAERTTPGAALAVGRHGGLVLLRGYGAADWAGGASPVTDSTIYDLASLTKVIATTTAAMLLEEDGALELERPVHAYLPEFDTPEKREITVRSLLTHRSGMTTRMLHREASGRDQYLERIRNHPLDSSPESRTLYSDWNMITLQLVVERIAYQPLDEFLHARVFGPLGMRDTGFAPDAARKPRIAPTEVQEWRGGQVHGEVHDENAWALGGVAGHAGLFSSARDLAVFAQMLLNGGAYGGTRILRPETVARWTARQDAGSSRALGWDTPSPRSSAGRYFSPRSFGHTGFTGTSIWIDPQKDLFVVLLTNRVNPTRENPRIAPLRRAVADAVQQAVLDTPLRLWERADATAGNR